MIDSSVYMRLGVSVVLTRGNKVALFERRDVPGSWQFPQGGMDQGESPQETLFRELFEETAIPASALTDIHRIPFSTHYIYPEVARKKLPSTVPNSCVGQTHLWFIAVLNQDTVIDLANASDQEFSDYQWVEIDHVLPLIVEWKHPAYTQIIDYLSEYHKAHRPT